MNGFVSREELQNRILEGTKNMGDIAAAVKSLTNSLIVHLVVDTSNIPASPENILTDQSKIAQYVKCYISKFQIPPSQAPLDPNDKNEVKLAKGIKVIWSGSSSHVATTPKSGVAADTVKITKIECKGGVNPFKDSILTSASGFIVADVVNLPPVSAPGPSDPPPPKTQKDKTPPTNEKPPVNNQSGKTIFAIQFAVYNGKSCRGNYSITETLIIKST